MANGTLKVSNIQTSSGSGTITIGQSGETVALGSGASQTLAANTPAFSVYASSSVSSISSGDKSTTSSTFSDLSGVSLSITPSATSSKILLMLNTNM